MQFSIATIATMAAAVAASPCKAPSSTAASSGSTSTSAPAAGVSPINLLILRSGSDIHYKSVQAATSRFLAGAPVTDGACTYGNGTTEAAAFQLAADGSLSLYADHPPHQAYVDPSDKGQGLFGYTTGAQPMPAGGERTGFALDASNDLTFDGKSFVACPDANSGQYTIWVGTVAAPNGLEGCLGISIRAVDNPNADMCAYSQ